LSQRTYLRIISGQAPAGVGVPVRLALTALSWPYSVVVRVRNHLYDSGRLKIHRVDVPVICAGNLTTGGTGKTPLVLWLCRYLRDRQIRCAILTRGYRTQKGRLSDEPALLAARGPGAAVIVNPDRVAGAAEAIWHRGAQALVMDDGFQHRRLARDLDLVAIDATQPFGYGKVLPAGLLREPITGLRRAHAVVLTRCDQVSARALARIEQDIRRINPDLVVARSIHAPIGVRTRDGGEIRLDALCNLPVFAFCGIGNPPAFFHTVEQLGGVLVGSKAYADHYRYRAADLDHVHREAVTRGTALILTTQKDWTKIAKLAFPQGRVPLAYLAVELRIIAGAQELIALLDRAVGGRIPTP
jgi:tetraacyldisaccharide 4'-kinase